MQNTVPHIHRPNTLHFFTYISCKWKLYSNYINSINSNEKDHIQHERWQSPNYGSEIPFILHISYFIFYFFFRHKLTMNTWIISVSAEVHIMRIIKLQQFIVLLSVFLCVYIGVEFAFFFLLLENRNVQPLVISHKTHKIKQIRNKS